MLVSCRLLRIRPLATMLVAARCCGHGIVLLLLAVTTGHWARGAELPADDADSTAATAALDADFRREVQPLLAKYCVRCHGPDEMSSGVRVDQLTGTAEERHLNLWKGIQRQVDAGAMPPDDEAQPTAAERKRLAAWIGRALDVARQRPRPNHGTIRRLTVAQYRNTLRDLLGLLEDFTEGLPPDAPSKDGFTGDAETLTLSPLILEAYFDIAERALDAAMVDEARPPAIQSFRMELGSGINPEPCPDQLILGANSELLPNADFVVTEPVLDKPFAFEPRRMRTAYEFIEGYQGNDTVRGWRKYDSIYHSVFACIRGTPGYPKGQAVAVVPQGMLLRPAIPSEEVFGQSNTYGPMANFKISLRELPVQGNFRVRVRAASYDDALLLDAGSAPQRPASGQVVANLSDSAENNVTIGEAGIYQIDVERQPGEPTGQLSLKLGDRQVASTLPEQKGATTSDEAQATAFALTRLPAGDLEVAARMGNEGHPRRLIFTRVTEDSEAGRRFRAFEERRPWLGVYLGLRRDCGSTLARVGAAQPVARRELTEYVFEGAIRDFPSPDVEPDNVNYLAGIREIGVRSEYTDGRDRPRLWIRSIEFEGPFYETWPPISHRRIFFDSPSRGESDEYAREVIRRFATRAFRRPITPAEEESLVGVFRGSRVKQRNFQASVKDALLVVLTSPAFLFQIEASTGPQAEDVAPHELASKLAYFLWNTAPDERLLELAARNELHAQLDAQTARLMRDPRFGQFVDEFASQWLSLEKLDVVAIDAARYPRLSRDVRAELRREPAEYLKHLLAQNRPLRELITSDYVVVNEMVADYYELPDRPESGLAFVPLRHGRGDLGGLLSQAGILAGLSDGRESNPVKRGAWLARKIIAEPPDDPPPNVPELKEDAAANLSLRERLELHRNQKGCAQCHAGIDPWGLPFEAYDAAGIFRSGREDDTRSKLPDGTDVADLNALKTYLAGERIDQVAFGFLKHLATYAAGRSLTYRELAVLRGEGLKLRASGYPVQDLVRLVVHSDPFLKK
ncbi:MAG: DUF1592 domain-containing protein [Pirellulaceae bacterium]|nr:DUF1592 domain-containing protein [Pirellulaceae bacterium]